MFDLARGLGVQSYCFRNFKSVPALLQKICELGLDRTEVCGVHIDFNDDRSFETVLAQFKSAGITITSIGVQTFKGEPSEEKWFAFARAAGAKMISATFDVSHTPAAYAATEKLADKYDLVLGIHNHGGYDWLGNSTMLQHVLAQTSERIGLCLDTAWCLQAGENPVQWAKEFHRRLYGVHLKDFMFDRAGKWSDTILGTGNLNLPDFLSIALTAPRLAAATLEYEGDPDNPVPKLKECIEAVRGTT